MEMSEDPVARLEAWCDNTELKARGTYGPARDESDRRLWAYRGILTQYRNRKREYRTVQDREARNIAGWCSNELLVVIKNLADALNPHGE